MGVYTGISRIYNNNILYISALVALKHWYAFIRPLFCSGSDEKMLLIGLQENLDLCLEERIRRLKSFGVNLGVSKHIIENSNPVATQNITLHRKTIDRISLAVEIFNAAGKNVDTGKSGFLFMEKIKQKDLSGGYIKTIQNLSDSERQIGSAWLHEIEQTLFEKLSLQQDK